MLYPMQDRNKPRVYGTFKVYPADSQWNTAPDSLKEAQLSAKMLQAVVKDENVVTSVMPSLVANIASQRR